MSILTPSFKTELKSDGSTITLLPLSIPIDFMSVKLSSNEKETVKLHPPEIMAHEHNEENLSNLWDIEAENKDTAEFVYSGECMKEVCELVDVCFKDASATKYDSHCVSVATNVKKKLHDVNICEFSLYLLPEFCDRVAAVAVSVTFGVAWITDDIFDHSLPNIPKFEMTSNMWSTIFTLAEQKWYPSMSAKCLFQAICADLTPDHDSILLDGTARLLAYGVSIARVRCGNGSKAYEWFVRESLTWIKYYQTESPVFRPKDMREFSINELVARRFVEGATNVTMAYVCCCSGIAFDQAVIDAPITQFTAILTGIHVCLVNDIFSYDREMMESGANQNLVEYLRKYHDNEQSLTRALRRTVQLCNHVTMLLNQNTKNYFCDDYLDNNDRFAYTEDREHLQQQNMAVDICTRFVRGNIKWSLAAKRYSNKDFIRSIIE